MLEAIRFVDEVISESSWEQKENDIISHGVDVFVMGDDWAGHFDYLSNLCDVIYLPRTPNVSSTMIKKLLQFDE